MSVLEFFTSYWDWYLLIGFFFAVASAVIGDPARHEVGYAVMTAVSCVILWPVWIIVQASKL